MDNKGRKTLFEKKRKKEKKKEPIHQKYKANENTSKHNPKKKKSTND